MRRLRLGLLGYSGFLEAIGGALVEAGAELACLATHAAETGEANPVEAAMAARGLHRPMAEIAAALGIPLLRLPDPNAEAAIASLKAAGADAVLSCSAPILRRPFIEAFEGRVFNFHGSRTYRGRAGWSWLILNDVRDDAVVLHWVDAGIDTGDWIAAAGFTIPAGAYPADVAAAQLPAFRELSLRLAGMLAEGVVSRERPAAPRPYLPSLSTERDGALDWSWEAAQIERCVRAFGWPYGGAAARLQHADRTTVSAVRIARVEPAAGPPMHPKTYGCVLGRRPGGGVEVACRGGSVSVLGLRRGAEEAPASDVVRLGMRFVEMARP